MLTTNEPVKELGKLKFGKPYTFDFKLKNDSEKPILVDKVIVGCGSCTTATLSGNLIQPGTEATLRAIFTPGTTGKQSKYINVKYDSGAVLKLEFTAHVDP